MTTIFGQKLDYDNDSKWFWGINTGIAWSTTDVKTKHPAAWGLTLGKAFNYNYGKKISFDIRARYLGGKWRGQDYDTTSLLDYNKEFTPFGNVKTNFIYHENVVPILFKLLNHKGVVNLGGKSQTIYQFAKKDNKQIKEIFLKKKNKIGMPINSSMNLKKLNKILKK